ncbi:FtsK/SpoIIIE domain-containing protein [Kineococcus sp. LSe6-4]|uniref:FtsK/SpoIIIE domain-containing protein n=1 Tax=Kineococcus halophytocola TaxID=3234027 RepID=A0ABV4H8M0_9ACTN
MPFRMTVLGVDVLVEVPTGTTVETARAQFEEVTGPWPPDWPRAWGLDPAAVLGFPPLLAGSCWPGPGREPQGVEPQGVEPQGVEPQGVEPQGVELLVAAGPDAGARFTLPAGTHVVGREAAGTSVALGDPAVSRRHAELRVDDGAGATVRDLGSLNGTRLLRTGEGPGDENGDGDERADRGFALEPGASFTVGDTVLRRGPVSVDAALAQPDGQGHLLVNRPPRLLAELTTRSWRWPLPAPQTEAPGPPYLGLFVPLAVAVVLALVWTPLSLLLGLASPVVAGGQWWGQRRRHRRLAQRAETELAAAREVVLREHADALRRESAERRARHPGAEEVHAEVVGRGDRLFRRRREDPDHLTVRVGLGPAQARTAAVQDGAGPASRLQDVPVVVDLAAGPVGVCGPGGPVAAAVRWWLVQLAAWQSPADVHLLTAPEWEWAHWLPHHTAPAADGDVLTAALAEVRARADGRGGPALVVVLDPVAWWHGDGRLSDLLTDGPAAGVHTVCVGAERAELPPACRTVVDLGPGGPAVRTAGGDRPVRPDGVHPEWALALARAAAPLRDGGTPASDALPADVHLLALTGPVDPDRLRREWTAPPAGLPAVVGADAAGPVVVDLVRDGPHTLLAGTTGAGKSVLLTTLVLALALRTPPEGLQFVLVDYKGGAAFGGCTGLPHVAGLVTDLDDQLAARVLRSLRAEVVRRERVLAEAGVPDAGELAPGVLPRLVVVVDEFRVLAQEVPEFVDGLVRLAAVGRSLGVHLVLATQRPAGVVSPEIRANTDLRLALRVQDRADAEDVVADPRPAAFTVPGRALLRSGTAGARPFQTARLRGPQRGALTVEAVGEHLGSGGPRPEVDALPDLVQAVRTAAAGRPRPRAPWLPPLPPVVGPHDLPPGTTGGLAWGLADHPDRQDRSVARWDLDAGSHLLVVGGVRSGRTTLLRRLVVAAGQRRDVEVHVLDAGGGLRDLAGTGGTGSVVGREEVWRAGRVLERVQAEVDARRAGTVPASGLLLLVVDGWESWSAALAAADPVAGTDPLLRLLREGSGAGLRVVVAGDRQCLTGAVAATAGQVVLLRTADRGDASLLGVRPAEVPRAAVAGRGLLVVDGRATEVQVALPGSPEPARATRFAVAPLPRSCPVPPPAGAGLVLGRGGDGAGPVVVGVDPVLVVAGPAGSGRTTALRTLAAQEPGCVWAREAGAAAVRAALAAGRLVLLDDATRPLPPEVEDALVGALQDGRPVRVVVAGEGQELAGSFRGPAALARALARTTVLLGRGDRVPADLVGRRPLPAPGPGPGAGFVVREGVWTSVRVGAADCPTVAG